MSGVSRDSDQEAHFLPLTWSQQTPQEWIQATQSQRRASVTTCSVPILPSPPPGWLSLLAGVSLREIGPGQQAAWGPKDLGGWGPGARTIGGHIPSPLVPTTLTRTRDPLRLPSAGIAPRAHCGQLSFRHAPEAMPNSPELGFSGAYEISQPPILR